MSSIKSFIINRRHDWKVKSKKYKVRENFSYFLNGLAKLLDESFYNYKNKSSS